MQRMMMETYQMADIINITCPTVLNPSENFVNGDYRYRMQISKYYQLADVTIRPLYPHHMKQQNNLGQSAIICNLASLAVNVLDPLAVEYPEFTINLGLKDFTDGKSAHESGEAVDVQWDSIKIGNLSKYLEIATWLSLNVPFDVIILGHGTTCWIHVSMSRSQKNRGIMYTFKDGLYTTGLSLLGRT